jgi:hypothetical protein
MKPFSIPRISGVLLFLILPSGTALAQQAADSDVFKVRDLYATCAVARGSADYDVATAGCRGFIGGAVQYHDAVSDRKHLKRLICYPQAATVADGRAAFLRWAENNAGNQARMDELAVIGLVRALAEAYPCQ